MQKIPTPISELPNQTGRPSQRRWIYVCGCGREFVTRPNAVRSGNTKSCGCMKSSAIRQSKTTHGMTGTPTYQSWYGMIQRCTNPKHVGYKTHGGRGICVSPEWRRFEAFLRDMGVRPHGCSIDRVDNGGNYSPENCEWATRTQQNRNTRSNVMITRAGRTLCASEWAEHLGVSPRTFRQHLYRGRTPQETLTFFLEKANAACKY